MHGNNLGHAEIHGRHVSLEMTEPNVSVFPWLI
jgi:hypothetical protein